MYTLRPHTITHASLLKPLLFSLSLLPFHSSAQLGGSGDFVIDEIVVTATARAENLQDIAVSVLAVQGDDIQAFGATNTSDVTANLPAVNVSSNPISNFIFMRGIGTPGANQGIEQSVSIFHDGIYMGRNQLSRAPLMDLERLEVMRGPQSILFGKNTIGGAIHMISAKPTDEFEGSVGVLLGFDDGEQELNVVLSGPLSDTVRGRLAFRDYQMDGYLDNILSGEDAPARDDNTLRGQLEIDASDDVTITAKWETSEFNAGEKGVQLSIIDPFTPGATAISALNQGLVAAATGGTGLERLDTQTAVTNDGGVLLGLIQPAFAGLPGFPSLEEKSDNDMNVGSIVVDWYLDGYEFKSVTGHAGYDYRDICDCDFSALPLIQVDATEDYEQFSQEFRITSPLGKTIDYVAGLYYQSSDLLFDSKEAIGTTLSFNTVPSTFTPPSPPFLQAPLQLPNLARDYVFEQDSEMWAVFGSATWNINDLSRLTLGVRYFEEEKKADHILTKRLADGWDYTPLVGAPVNPAPVAGNTIFGATAADYDQLLIDQPQMGAVTEFVYAALLGTTEHDIRGRERSEEDINWSITFEHDVNLDTLAFASISTGTKGGGFDARFLQDANNPFFEYDEEEAISYEIGIKSTLLSGAMNFNAVAFYSTVEDYQVSIFDGATAFFVTNAGEIESKGLELDIQWLLTENFSATFAGSILDAEYSKFPNAPCWAGTAANNRGNCSSRTPGTDQFRDASGDTNIFSPDYSFNLTLDYSRTLASGLEWRSTLVTNYNDDHFVTADLDPIYARQDAYTTYDLRLAVISEETGWEIAMLGKNLTDEKISANSNDQPLVPGNGYTQLNRLRSYAVQGIYRF